MTQPKKWTQEDMPDLNNKVAIVTGANAGLGFEDTRYLSRKGATVIAGCRDLEKGENAKHLILDEDSNAKLDVMRLDLSSLNSIKNFSTSAQKKYDHVDILINNAGVMWTPYSRTEDGFELQFGINYLGHFALTGLLLPSIVNVKDSRIVTMSSIGHRDGKIDFDDVHFEKRKYDKDQAYNQSKLACLLFALELNDRLKKNGYSTISLAAHPGFSRTELYRHSSFLRFSIFYLARFLGMSAESGSRFALYAATASEAKGGSFYGPSGKWQTKGFVKEIDLTKEPNVEWFTEENQARLWKMSEEMTKIKYL
jgi:NAD(P)-dependent dehydrogenase (short-subunit alcohol dehydrogenase family)